MAFDGLLSGDATKTGIIVPDEVIDQLAAGHRPPVAVTLNGYEFRSTVAVMGGTHMIGVSAAVRAATALNAGDVIAVSLRVDATPRAIGLPDDFAKALTSSGMQAFFDGLPNSLQRFHVDQVVTAKSDETRQRRIAKAVELFRAGQRR